MMTKTITSDELHQLRMDAVPGYGTAAQLKLHEIEEQITAGELLVIQCFPKDTVRALLGGKWPEIKGYEGFAYETVHHYKLEDGLLQPYAGDSEFILPGPAFRLVPEPDPCASGKDPVPDGSGGLLDQVNKRLEELERQITMMWMIFRGTVQPKIDSHERDLSRLIEHIRIWERRTEELTDKTGDLEEHFRSFTNVANDERRRLFLRIEALKESR
jgi:hypothetical protein